MSMDCERNWARETFGDLRGDRRLAERVVRMATRAAYQPHGLVTQVFERAAEREGAFRFLENHRARSSDLRDVVFDATARACPENFFVAVDGSTLSLVERTAKRELGGVGAWKDFGRGLHVQSALALDEKGVPIGLCGQLWWAREARRSKRRRAHKAMEGETRFPVQLLHEMHARFDGKRPWYLFDRGYDVWPVLKFICNTGSLATVRAKGTRFVLDSKNRRRNVKEVLASAPRFGTIEVDITSRPGRAGGLTEFQLRACTVQVSLAVGRKRRELVHLNAVLVDELAPSRGSPPIQWLLFTSHSIATKLDVQRIATTYALRWRIEDFHRAWKDGVCRVERTQLRSREALIKWATILGAVATRATRLTHLARNAEALTQPATTEFTPDEIEAIVVLRKPKNVSPSHQPSLAEAVRWIADLGGYTGKSSGGPPGATVIGRGLAKVEVLVDALPALRARLGSD